MTSSYLEVPAPGGDLASMLETESFSDLDVEDYDFTIGLSWDES